jgi:Flp pilus assembly protein TadG
MKKKTLLPRSAKGQSLVELAISLVILLYLLSGAVEFGILFFRYVQLRDAAQEGALYGSTHPDDITGIEARAKGSSQSPLDLPSLLSLNYDSSSDLDAGKVDMDVSITDGTVNPPIASTDATAYAAVDCEGSNHAVTVQLTYNHRIFMPFLPQLIGRSTIPLNASVTDTILSPKC